MNRQSRSKDQEHRKGIIKWTSMILTDQSSDPCCRCSNSRHMTAFVLSLSVGSTVSLVGFQADPGLTQCATAAATQVWAWQQPYTKGLLSPPLRHPVHSFYHGTLSFIPPALLSSPPLSQNSSPWSQWCHFHCRAGAGSGGGIWPCGHSREQCRGELEEQCYGDRHCSGQEGDGSQLLWHCGSHKGWGGGWGGGGMGDVLMYMQWKRYWWHLPPSSSPSLHPGPGPRAHCRDQQPAGKDRTPIPVLLWVIKAAISTVQQHS